MPQNGNPFEGYVPFGNWKLNFATENGKPLRIKRFLPVNSGELDLKFRESA